VEVVHYNVRIIGEVSDATLIPLGVGECRQKWVSIGTFKSCPIDDELMKSAVVRIGEACSNKK
jgi:hypothetical protein